MKRILMVCVALTLLALPVMADDVAGASTFKGKCVMCHGADGGADTAMGKKVAATDLRTDAVQSKDDTALIEVVTKGKNKMPAFGEKLDADQIKAVVAFIRTLKK